MTSSMRTNLTNGGSPGAAMEMIDLKSPEDILTMEYWYPKRDRPLPSLYVPSDTTRPLGCQILLHGFLKTPTATHFCLGSLAVAVSAHQPVELIRKLVTEPSDWGDKSRWRDICLCTKVCMTQLGRLSSNQNWFATHMLVLQKCLWMEHKWTCNCLPESGIHNHCTLTF